MPRMCTSCLEEKHAGVIYGLHTGGYDFRYIGKSINHKDRARRHRKDAKQGQYPVHNWMRKHGRENIHMTIIETFDEETIGLIDERERFHIAQCRAYYSENLNLTDGGDGRSGHSPSAETRAKLAAVNLGKKASESARANMKAASARHWLGATRTEETKAKIAASKLGSKHSEESKAKMSTSHKGRPATVGNHIRWHVGRDKVSADCSFCNENGSQ